MLWEHNMDTLVWAVRFVVRSDANDNRLALPVRGNCQDLFHIHPKTL